MQLTSRMRKGASKTCKFKDKYTKSYKSYKSYKTLQNPTKLYKILKNLTLSYKNDILYTNKSLIVCYPLYRVNYAKGFINLIQVKGGGEIE